MVTTHFLFSIIISLYHRLGRDLSCDT